MPVIPFDAGTLLEVSRYYGCRSGPSNQLTMVLAGSGPVRDVVEHSVDVVTQKQMVSCWRTKDYSHVFSRVEGRVFDVHIAIANIVRVVECKIHLQEAVWVCKAEGNAISAFV